MNAKAVGILVSLLLPAWAWADEVHLRNGSALQGRVTEQGDRVMVELDYGTVTVDRKDVGSIDRGANVLDDLDQKLKAAQTADQIYEAGVWADRQGFANRARAAFARAIVVDPNHENARKALGYVKYEDRWMTPDEVHRAQGKVLYEGTWVTPEQRAALREKEVELQATVAQVQQAEEAARQRRIAEDRARAQQALTEQASPQFYSWVTPQGLLLPGNRLVPGVVLETPQPAAATGASSSTLPLSGVPSTLPMSGIPQALPLSGVPSTVPMSAPPRPRTTSENQEK